ncbi:17998_t:CDS:2 [Cetraspora pellucida]|uniref:17998_t:CDS:1 n=1 Tax=Cetraspora pellucida TaxID=1433469 RepID=A0A9N8ZEU3_9GLOM|nr:17998_t:CDS:2 [Cetraspora pellucida]
MYSLVSREVAKKEIVLIKYESHQQRPTISLVENFEGANDENIRELMLELKSIEHENVLKVFGLTFDENSRCYYVVREYAKNRDLRTYLSGSSLAWNDKYSLSLQIVNGLKFLHDNGITHTELHPKNILIHNGIPKLTNIWLPKFKAPTKFSFIRYCPPEILSLRNITPNKMKLDIYRLGVLLWEISSNGVEPFSKGYKCSSTLAIDVQKGKNYVKYDCVHGEGIILRDDGELKIQKVIRSTPIIYYSKKSSVFSDITMDVEPENDYIRIHFPICTVQYQSEATDEFILDIKITEAILGGAITIKNWSKIDNASKSRLKSYIQWGIDYAKGKKLNVFENVSLDGLPPLPSYEASEPMKCVGDLYNWLNDLYRYRNLEIISYEKIKPSYQSLPNDLIQKIYQCSSLHLSKSYSSLVPQIPSQYDCKDFLEWIKSPPLELYMRDWIQNNLLQHGVLLQRSKLGHGTKPALKFLREPEITQINKVTILISQPQTLQEAYLLENGIILKNDELELDKIPFAEYGSSLDRPLVDFKNSECSEKVYCQIIFHAVKISFDPSSIKYLKEFSDTVDSALETHDPFKNLCTLFGNDYGHLLPRTFTLGGVLSRSFKPRNDITNFTHARQFEFEGNDPDAPQEIEEILKIWNGESQDIDTSLFLNNDGDIIRRNKIGDWWKTLSDSPSNWKVISSEDWMPLYKVLDDTNQNIEAILNNEYHLVFNGKESLHKNQTTLIINFPGPIENNYYIFGNVVKENNGVLEIIPETTIQFRYQNKNGCAAYILKNRKARLNLDNLKVLWFVLAKPNGYYSNKNRNVRFAYGELDIDNSQSEITLNSENIYSNCVLMTSFVPKTPNDTTIYNIALKAWTEATIELEVQRKERDDDLNQAVIKKIGLIDSSDEDSSDDSESTMDMQEPHEKITLQWCIMYVNEKEPMKSEDKGEYPWNLFGIILDENFRKG